MLFKEVIGLEKIKKELVYGVAKKRIAHAQLFNGPKGSGKLALAIAYARFINCNSPKENDSCQECSSCLQFSKLSHPDFHVLYPVIKTANNKTPQSSDSVSKWTEYVLKNPYLSLNQWSDVYKEEFLEKLSDKKKEATIYSHQIKEINKKLSLKIFSAKYRVVLIWMPEKMNVETSNKLLKIFEEPPKGTVFLLVSETPKKLLATVMSRLQEVKINDFTIEDKKEFLNKYNLTGDQLELLKSSIDLDFGKVIQLLNEDLQEIGLLEEFSAWMRFAYKTDILGIVKWVDVISTSGRKQQIAFLSYAIKIIRECLIFNYTKRKVNFLFI